MAIQFNKKNSLQNNSEQLNANSKHKSLKR